MSPSYPNILRTDSSTFCRNAGPVRPSALDLAIETGKEQDARNMFRMMDKDGNGLMEFAEFVLVLILPKSAEQFAHCKSSSFGTAATYTLHTIPIEYISCLLMMCC